MKEKIKTFFAVLILLLTIPYIFTMALQGTTSDVLPVSSQSTELEEVLIARVALDIPVEYELEAIKAQVILARTAFQKEKQQGNSASFLASSEEWEELWGMESYEKNYQKISQAVKETENVVLRYQGQLPEVAFHAVSAGSTRNATELLGKEEMLWMQSVESFSDISSEDYLKVLVLEKEEIGKLLKPLFPQSNLEMLQIPQEIEILKRDGAEYVTQVKIGEKTITGEEFRHALSLPSACFYLKEVEGKVRIVVKGLGHGLGMSQYGANEMAKKGASCEEILNYYFKNVEISD